MIIIILLLLITTIVPLAAKSATIIHVVVAVDLSYKKLTNYYHIYACTYVRERLRKYTNIHTYTHIHTHSYIHGKNTRTRATLPR